MEGKYIIVSGPVIIEEGRLLVIKDNKDDFYKLPGGTVKMGETLESAGIRETKEEINADIEIISPISPLLLWENPTTKERMTILLNHYNARINNRSEIKPLGTTQDIKWLPLDNLRSYYSLLAPNIKMLIDRGQFN